MLLRSHRSYCALKQAFFWADFVLLPKSKNDRSLQSFQTKQEALPMSIKGKDFFSDNTYSFVFF